MKNAHQRFGRLVYVRRTEKTSTISAFTWMPLLAKSAARLTLFRLLTGMWRLGQLQRLATVTSLRL